MMKSFLLIASVALTVMSTHAFAQPAGGVQANPNTSPPGAQQDECAKARNREHCAARLTARAACKSMKGAAFRQCVEDAMPAPDCGKARNPLRCAEQEKARQSCKGKVGREHKQCLRDALASKK